MNIFNTLLFVYRVGISKIVAPLLKTTEADMLSRTALGMRNVTLCDYFLATGQPKKAFETSKIYLDLRKNAGSNDKLDLQTLNEYFQHITICLQGRYFKDRGATIENNGS